MPRIGLDQFLGRGYETSRVLETVKMAQILLILVV